MHFFLTGTDTDVGKTHTARLIIETLRNEGIDAVGFKPVCCGDREDAHILATASAISVEEVNPLWLKTPAAPWVAAQLQNTSINSADLLEKFFALTKKHQCVIVEGAGGWEVPLTENETMADLAANMNIPVVIVVANRLGAINHSILTAKNISARNIECKGIILNHLADELDTVMISNKNVIPLATKLPLLTEIIHGQDWLDVDWIHG